MDIKIRKAGVNDIPLMLALLEGLFAIETDFEFNPIKQKNALMLLIDSREDRVVYAAFDGSLPVGMLTGQIVISTASGGYSVLLEDLFVLPEYRENGIGAMLLGQLADWGRKHGAVRIQLVADLTNSNATEFYLSKGFNKSRMAGFYLNF